MTNLELRTVLDGLGQGILIFNNDGRLILENLTARHIVGTDIETIRKEGWAAASTLFNATVKNPDQMIENVRKQALETDRPVRFYTFLRGQHIPCSAAAVHAEGGDVHLMITLEMPDWSAVTTLVDRFREEMKDAITSTQGHIDLIRQTIKHRDAEAGVDTLARRISGFTRLIGLHMNRVERLMKMLERLEYIRTGQTRKNARNRRREIDLTNYIEDFIEELDEITLVDPETDAHDHRSRITVDLPDDLAVVASSYYLTRILQDVLRNAIMYSMKATPIKITVTVKGRNAQFDITDEGYGIRDSEHDRVFALFERALQPQIMGEFGYGLSLYLCKHEVEAMNGKMWFDSAEGVGTTFSFMLPLWQDDASDSSNSADKT
jgi:signal transduction histidine kinase